MALAPVRPENVDQITDNIRPWEEVAEIGAWPSLLVGNGLSQNVWAGFGYGSLFDLACEGEDAHLNAADRALFDRFATLNFESVLSALRTSIVVETTLGQPTGHLEERETSIRNALVRAVHGVHVPWRTVPDAHLDRICASLSLFTSLYSTNYDLLIYWAMMRDPNRFRDFFFAGERFDPENTEVWNGACAVHFLHGGLHLYRVPNGGTLKRSATEALNLLDLFGTSYGDASPLFVSEGTAHDKLSSIYRSDYLSFVFSRLEADSQPLVIFGHGLGESDRHIVRAIGAREGRRIAISLRTGGNVRQRKAELIAALPEAELYFFDAATHPLGAPDLRVEPPAQ